MSREKLLEYIIRILDKTSERELDLIYRMARELVGGEEARA